MEMDCATCRVAEQVTLLQDEVEYCNFDLLEVEAELARVRRENSELRSRNHFLYEEMKGLKKILKKEP